MKEMACQEAVDWVAIPCAASALLQVVDPVLTGVLDFGWQAGIDSLLVDF